jgi:predicted permease
MDTTLKPGDLEIAIKPGDTKAVIEGKTGVSFKTFVQLVLQRKVTTLFKDWGSAPVIVPSELLTSLASAQQDSQENRSQVVLVTLGTGTLLGVFAFAAIQAGLLWFGIELGMKELAIVLGSLFALLLLVLLLGKAKRGNRSDRLVESMEKLSSLLTK